MQENVAAVATLLTHWGHRRSKGVRAALGRGTDPCSCRLTAVCEYRGVGAVGSHPKSV